MVRGLALKPKEQGGTSTWAARLLSRVQDPRDTWMQVQVAVALLCMEAVLLLAIILRVPYTEIDWTAYMEEVSGFIAGERDYTELRGGTGPLVYPAGFVYLFSLLKWATSEAIVPAQYIFGLLYLATQASVMALYISAQATPPWALALLTLSKRIHSIYVLRLFNDCWATAGAYAALLLLCRSHWALAIIAFSAAVSIKMNVLLMAPSVLVICLLGAPVASVARGVAGGVALQLALAAPFLAAHPWSYVSRAFEFSRVFAYKWTVNWRMLPEHVFLAPGFAKVMLALHLGALLAFAHHRWLRPRGGTWAAVHGFYATERRVQLTPELILRIVFTGNFVGIVFARSLHYQFYAWYFHSLPFLLWQARLPAWSRLPLLLLIEVCWNVYPSTVLSSSAMLAAHGMLLSTLWLQSASR